MDNAPNPFLAIPAIAARRAAEAQLASRPPGEVVNPLPGFYYAKNRLGFVVRVLAPRTPDAQENA